jgi:cyclophilin family peptidyl-prolyl cis-trans isomerase
MNFRITTTMVILSRPRIFLAALLIPSLAASVINVRMQTDLGGIDIELLDTVAPLTVANFLNYVNDGDYESTFFHRSVPGFVVQGGGFIFNASDGDFFSGGVSHIPTDPPIVNEFILSNLRGTIAMAKADGDPDSATSEWFFNLDDNSGNLDSQNGGFTVFARVLGSGMEVVDAIAALPRCVDVAPFPQLCSTFTEVPFAGSGAGAFNNDTLININHIGTDNDGDGAIDDLEDAAPNTGDGNSDTILDSTQQHVASFPGDTGEYVIVESQPASPLESLDVLGKTFALVNTDAAGVLVDREFANGYFGFKIINTIPGDNTVLISLPSGSLPDAYFNFGPTPEELNPHWYDFAFDGVTGAEFNGNVITLHFVDGLRGDTDLLQDGIITAARGGPASIVGDGDGVSDQVEDGAPNNGDGNNDGIPDKQQRNVASLVDAVSGGYFTVEVGADLLLQNLQVTDGSNILFQSGSSSDLSGLNFTHGFLGFEVKNMVPGSDIEVKIYLPNNEKPVKFFKFGPTPDNQADHLYEFDFNGETGAEFSGNEVTLHFVDGKRGDSDLTANGIIADPGTPAIEAGNSGASGGGGGGCSLGVHRAGSESAGGWLLLAICISLLGIYRRLYQLDKW